MKAVREVLVYQFYRRNLLFFLLLGLFLSVFRPPTLLFGPQMIHPMLEDTRFFFGVMAGLIIYYGKCWWETFRAIHLPENAFLYVLGSENPFKLGRRLAEEFFLLVIPAFAYALVIVGYSIAKGTWHAWAILGGHGSILLLGVLHLVYTIYRPREVQVRLGIQTWLERRFKKSFAFIMMQLMLRHHGRAFVLTKTIAMALLIASLTAHVKDAFLPKSLNLIFLSIISLQCMFAYYIRRKGDKALCVFRNLPIPLAKRLGAYMLMGAILLLPETFVFFMWRPAPLEMFSFMSMGMAIYLLGISVLYYKPLQTYAYLRLVFAAYFVFFLAILYGAPLWALGIGAFLFAIWIFWEEFYNWDGYLEP